MPTLPVGGSGGDEPLQVPHRVGGLGGGQIIGVGGSAAGLLARVGLDQLPTVEQLDQLVVRASLNPLTDKVFRRGVERPAHLHMEITVHGHLDVNRHCVPRFGRRQQRTRFVFGEHLARTRTDGAVDPLAGLVRAPGLGAGLRVGQIHEFLTGEEVSAHVLHAPLDPRLVPRRQLRLIRLVISELSA
jgi:hypothetical protein